MSSKENKRIKKEAKGVSMSELIKRGEMGEFDHLEEYSDRFDKSNKNKSSKT